MTMATAQRPVLRHLPEEYPHYRRALLRFFRSHQVPDPEDLADECMARVVSKLSTGHQVNDFPAYLYAVARLVLKETHRELARVTQLRRVPPVDAQPDAELAEALDACLERLSKQDRDLILGYYTGEGSGKIARRRQMASDLNLSLAALRTRVYRIRAQLEQELAAWLGRPL